MKSLKSINFIENPQEIQTLDMNMIRGGATGGSNTDVASCQQCNKGDSHYTGNREHNKLVPRN